MRDKTYVIPEATPIYERCPDCGNVAELLPIGIMGEWICTECGIKLSESNEQQ